MGTVVARQPLPRTSILTISAFNTLPQFPAMTMMTWAIIVVFALALLLTLRYLVLPVFRYTRSASSSNWSTEQTDDMLESRLGMSSLLRHANDGRYYSSVNIV